MGGGAIPTQIGVRAAAQDGGILSVLTVNVLVSLVGILGLLLLRYASAHVPGAMRAVRQWPRARAALWVLEYWFPHAAGSDGLALLAEEAFQLDEASPPSTNSAIPIEEESPSFVAWLWTTVRMGDEALLARCGHDGVVYLQFQRYCMIALVCMTAVSLGLVLPVNLLGDEDYEGFRWTTIENVGDSDWYWAHAVASVIMSGIVLGLIFFVRRHVMVSSKHFRNRRTAISSRTIMIEGAHPLFLSPELYQQHFSSLLHTLAQRARKASLSQEASLSLENDSFLKSISSDFLSLKSRIISFSSKKFSKKSSPVSSADIDSWHNRSRGDSSNAIEDTEFAVHGEDEGDTALVNWNGPQQRGVVIENDSDNEPMELDELSSDEEAANRRTGGLLRSLHVQIVPQLSELFDVYSQHFVQLARMQELLERYHRTGIRPTVARGIRAYFLGLCGNAQVDEMSETAEAMALAMRKLQKLRKHLYRHPATGVVFVTFPSAAAAKAVVHEYNSYHSWTQWSKRWLFRFSVHVPLTRPMWTLSRFSAVLGDRHWWVSLAPEPEDIQWTNLSIGRWEFRLRVFFLNVITAFFLMLWTTPLALLHFLVSVPLISQVYEQATGISSYSQLDAFVVSLLLLTLTLTLPNLIWASSWMEGHSTESAEHVSIALKTCLYLLFSLLILPVLWIPSLLSLFETGLLLQDQAYTLLDGIFDQSNGSLAINLLIQMALIGTFVEALRVPERLMRLWMYWKSRSAGERRKAAEYAYRHEFGMQYAFLVCVFSISLTFSTTIPLVPPFGLLYFACKHVLDKYHMTHVRPKTFESDGSLIFLVLKFMIAALLFFQMGVSVFFFLHGTVSQFFLVAALPLLLSLFITFNTLSAISLFKFTVLPPSVTVSNLDFTAYRPPHVEPDEKEDNHILL